MSTRFEIEEKELLLEYLNHIAFPQFRYGATPPVIESIELIIRPECNQKCQYCYITNHGDELYPKEERLDKKQILSNLNAILDYIYHQKKNIVKDIQLFAGDLLYDDLICDILDLLYKYLYESYSQWAQIYQKIRAVIVIPTNFHGFVKNDELYEKMKDYIKKMNDIDISLCFSCSTDGKYAVSAREQMVFDDEYWTEYFERAFQLNSGYHPMVSAETIENSIENFDWWIENLERVYFHEHLNDRPCFKPRMPFMLEVRNDNWTDEKIEYYLKFLEHIIQWRLSLVNNNIEKFAKSLYYDEQHDPQQQIPDYDIIRIKAFAGSNVERLGCGLQRDIILNIQNLTIVPCHRLAYKQFLGGKFITDENNLIIDVIPYNISQYLTLKYFKQQVLPKCESCENKYFCLRGCIGSQYEYSGELYYPIPCVCKLFKAKTDYLIKTYSELGIFKTAAKNNYLTQLDIDSINFYCESKGWPKIDEQ